MVTNNSIIAIIKICVALCELRYQNLEDNVLNIQQHQQETIYAKEMEVLDLQPLSGEIYEALILEGIKAKWPLRARLVYQHVDGHHRSFEIVEVQALVYNFQIWNLMMVYGYNLSFHRQLPGAGEETRALVRS